MKILTALIFSTISAVSFAAPSGYLEAKADADRDEASLGNAAGTLVQAQASVLAPLLSSCVADAGGKDLSPFVLVMRLDQSGRIAQTWRQGNSPISVCFEKAALGKSLTPPPRAPFYTSFEMHFTNK
jgi:hypothetical protein